MVQKTINLFFDFDGTIIDVSDRLYFLYRDLMIKYHQKPLPKKAYFNLKRNNISEERIIQKVTKKQTIVKSILRERQLKIEDKQYLGYDRLIPGAEKVLAKLSPNFDLFLITNRKNKQNFFQEVRRLRVEKYFQKLIASDNKFESIFKESPARNDIIIGDTEDDIQTGKKLGLTTIAVLSGMRSKKTLIQPKPDYIIDDIKQIFEVVFV